MENTKIVGALIVLALSIAAVWGWVLNVVAFVHMIGGEISTLFIARAIGLVVAPLGTVLGFI